MVNDAVKQQIKMPQRSNSARLQVIVKIYKVEDFSKEYVLLTCMFYVRENSKKKVRNLSFVVCVSTQQIHASTCSRFKFSFYASSDSRLFRR